MAKIDTLTRLEYKNRVLLIIKMAKIDTLTMTKTAEARTIF